MNQSTSKPKTCTSSTTSWKIASPKATTPERRRKRSTNC